MCKYLIYATVVLGKYVRMCSCSCSDSNMEAKSGRTTTVNQVVLTNNVIHAATASSPSGRVNQTLEMQKSSN